MVKSIRVRTYKLTTMVHHMDLQKFKTYINKTFAYLMITVMHIYFRTIVEKIIARTFNV